MGKLYRNDLEKYKNYFKESAKLLGVDIEYKYIIKKNIENQSGESVYSELSKPITISVVVEEGNPKVDSLKQLGWFVGDEENNEKLLVSFPTDTPNLQEGCRFSFVVEGNKQQNKEYVIEKLSNELLYPTCIKCLCHPILENESKYNNLNGDITYGQQDIQADDENYSYINEKPKISTF